MKTTKGNDKEINSKEQFAFKAAGDQKMVSPEFCLSIKSTTFKYETTEQMARLFDLEDSGYFYTRLQNPTNDAVAAKIAKHWKAVLVLCLHHQARSQIFMPYLTSVRQATTLLHHQRYTEELSTYLESQ